MTEYIIICSIIVIISIVLFFVVNIIIDLIFKSIIFFRNKNSRRKELLVYKEIFARHDIRAAVMHYNMGNPYNRIYCYKVERKKNHYFCIKPKHLISKELYKQLKPYLN